MCGRSVVKLGKVDVGFYFGDYGSQIFTEGIHYCRGEEDGSPQHREKIRGLLNEHSKEDLIEWILDIAISGEES